MAYAGQRGARAERGAGWDESQRTAETTQLNPQVFTNISVWYTREVFTHNSMWSMPTSYLYAMQAVGVTGTGRKEAGVSSLANSIHEKYAKRQSEPQKG